MYLVPQGAGLQVKAVLDQDSKKTFHISATEKRLILGAEGLKIKKRDKNNELKEITRENWQELQEICENSNTRLLNSADKQRIILDGLNDLRAPEEMTIPGCPDKKLYNGQAISKWSCDKLFGTKFDDNFILNFFSYCSSVGSSIWSDHTGSSITQQS